MNMQSRTASEGARPLPSRHLDAWLLDIGFVAFLLLIFVTLQPFASRAGLAIAPQTGEGDLIRQVCFLSLFALIVGAALWRRGFQALGAVPIGVAVTLGWCLLSAAWSIEPDVTLRRAILATVVVVSTMIAVDAVGAGRAMRIWRVILIGVLAINWVSVFVVPDAVHLPGDVEPDVVGAWRGLYFHKNIAGAVTAITALIFFVDGLKSRKWTDWALFAAAVGFLIGTNSKSSMGFLAMALVAAGFYRMVGRGGVDRLLAITAATFLFVIGAGYVMANWDSVVTALNDPTQFTGRAAIWHAEARYIGDHPFLGAGFGSFADTGTRSPLFGYMGEKWIGTVAHGHSGYLELMVTTGVIGFALALWAIVIKPARAFAATGRRQGFFTTTLFVIFVFAILHNTMESDFFEGAAPQWVALLMIIAMQRAPARALHRPWPL